MHHAIVRNRTCATLANLYALQKFQDEKMHNFQFQSVTKLISGIGSLQQLASECQRLTITKVLLVTDQGIIDHQLHLPLIKQLQQQQIQIEIYADVQADPSEQLIIQAISDTKAKHINGVIGFGGGSSLDVAKLIALLAHPQQTQTLQEIYGIEQARSPRLPLIQIPTTAGTGSEVTPIAIVTTGKTTKSGIVASTLYADIAILDATLTRDLPKQVTAATGIDAMVHAIEAFTSKHQKNPYSDMLAKQALQYLDRALPIVLSNPQDLAARQDMLLGAMLAGQAFANAPVAAVHALAYPLGGHCHLSHGHTNALVLVEVLKFNLSEAASDYAELMRCLDPTCTGDIQTMAQQFIGHMQQICKNSGLILKLNELGIERDLLATLAADAMLQTRLLANNPRPLTECDALAIYQAVYE